MRAALFFLCLCSLLLTGNAYSFAGIDQGSQDITLVPHTLKGPRLATPPTHAAYLNIAAPCTDYHAAFIIDDDAEDEDAAGMPIQKDRSPVAGFTLPSRPSCAFAIRYLSNSFRTPAPFLRKAPDLYLLQSVLRI